MPAEEDVSDAKDGSAMLSVSRAGAENRLFGLCVYWAHYRFLRAEGDDETIVASSKHQMSLVGSQMMMAEHEHAEPKRFVAGEMEAPEAVEFLCLRIGTGGVARLRLAEDALLEGRPPGFLTLEVELFRWESPCMGPGKPKWLGMRSVVAERTVAEGLLQGADYARGRLDAFDRLKASESQSKECALDVARAVRRDSLFAERRFVRARSWLESGALDKDPEEVLEELVRVLAGLARAMVLRQQQFTAEMGEGRQDFGRDLVQLVRREGAAAPEGGAREPDKVTLEAAKGVADAALELSPTNVRALAAAGIAYAACGELDRAREHIGKALEVEPHNESLRSELARVSVKERADGALSCEEEATEARDSLQAAIEAGDATGAVGPLARLGELVDTDKLTWEALMRLKIGKPVGVAMKTPPGGDLEVQQAATQLVRKFREMAERNRPLWS